MADYEVVVAIYRKGDEEPLAEETVLETDDLDAAELMYESLLGDEEDEEEEEPELQSEDE